GAHHYPSAATIPAPAEERVVVPGSEVARKSAVAGTQVPANQARYRLYLLGEALHVLQDSWSHQGMPEVPALAEAFACDPTRAWGHPAKRGGWNSHKADLTRHWLADTEQMAKATYDILVQYPAMAGVRRTPRNWDEVRGALARFSAALHKTEKKAWVVGQGVY